MFGAPFTAAFALTYSEAFLLSSSLDQRTPLRRYLPCLLSGKSPPFWMRSVRHWWTVLSILWIILPVNSAALVTVKDSLLTRIEQRSMATACLSSLSRVRTHPSAKSLMISLGVCVWGVTSGSAAVEIVDSFEGPLLSSVAALSLALAVVCSCWVRSATFSPASASSLTFFCASLPFSPAYKLCLALLDFSGIVGSKKTQILARNTF